MRTTVTLDPDVEQSIRKVMRERGVSFKQALNDAVRKGLLGAGRRRVKPLVQKTFPSGPEQGFRWDKALAIAEAMEDEEIGRKLSLRR